MTHEIIKTDNYLLVVDDSEIKESYWIGYPNLKQFVPVQYLGGDLTGYEKKIIAHLPLHNAPFLEGVDVLPPFDVEDDVEKLAEKLSKEYSIYETAQDDVYQGIIVGYNKAREKYKYTEEDARYLIMYSFLLGVDRGHYSKEIEDRIIQSTNQPKLPVAFECEMEYKFPSGREYVQPNPDYLPKTSTNNLGQTQWVGIYVYA